jgi:hypothetical protein
VFAGLGTFCRTKPIASKSFVSLASSAILYVWSELPGISAEKGKLVDAAR